MSTSSTYNKFLDPEAVFSTAETAEFLGVSTRYIQRARHEGRLASIRLSSNKVGHKRADLIKFRDTLRTPAAGE